MCASGLTIFGYILRQIAASALATIVIAVITMLLSKLTRKGIFALLAALVIFILGIIPDVMEVVLYNSIFWWIRENGISCRDRNFIDY